MKVDEKVKIQLPSGLNVDMSIDVHDNYFRHFTESQSINFSNFINAGMYFPQIMQFIMVLSAILNGRTSLKDIILCNVLFGAFYTLIWFTVRLYKIPGLAFVFNLIGCFIFRLFLHFVVIAVIAFSVIKDWKVLLYCIIGGLLAFIVKTILFVALSNVKYHDEVIKYVSALKL